MREDLLHFIWKYKKINSTDLRTTQQQSVDVIDPGLHNHLSGPDFFNAKINIGEQLWAGNVEIHTNASEWYAHGHEKDVNYDSVILHVVWEDDVAVFRKDGSEIPTLALKDYISKELLLRYQILFDKKQKTFINCEKDIDCIEAFVFQNWIERLYFERLERKSSFIFKLLEDSKNDWEQVLFKLLLKNFGLKINGESFLSLANAMDFSVIRKLQSDVGQLESVFFGMTHLLSSNTVLDNYYLQLKKEYEYLSSKYELNSIGVLKPEFFKLRPPNFPTIRLSQLANVYAKHEGLFEKIVNTSTLEELYLIFNVSASDYWSEHFTFGKASKKSAKKITKSFIDLLVINTIIPLKFCHAKHYGKDINETVIKIASDLKAEKNSIISNFKKVGVVSENAKESQGLLQLYNEFCTKNKCLSCVVGNSILQS